jgi:hypothetical protein
MPADSQAHFFGSLTHGMKVIMVGKATRKPLAGAAANTEESRSEADSHMELWRWPWPSAASKASQVIPSATSVRTITLTLRLLCAIKSSGLKCSF